MSSDSDKHKSETKPKGPFPHPAKNMNGDRSEGESDGRRDPSQAPGKRTLDREEVAEADDGEKDAAGEAKASEPQQSRELNRNRH